MITIQPYFPLDRIPTAQRMTTKSRGDRRIILKPHGVVLLPTKRSSTLVNDGKEESVLPIPPTIKPPSVLPIPPTKKRSSIHENTKIIQFLVRRDERGSLIAIEGMKDIPFKIKRAYWIYNTTPECSRGNHAHYNLKQVLVCFNGSCNVLVDDGENNKVVKLSQPDEGLFISGLIWREMFNFSSDCVLGVFASEHYDENDYIRTYPEFLKESKSI